MDSKSFVKSKLFMILIILAFLLSFVTGGFSTLIGVVMIVLRIKSKKKKRIETTYEQNKQNEENPVILAFRNIESGILPVFDNSPVVYKNEITHVYCQAIRYVTKNRVVGRTSSSSGVSIRVSKRYTYRSGGTQGHSIYGNVISAFHGEFVLTNKRIMFINDQQGFSGSIDSIGVIKEEENGRILIQMGKSSYLLHIVAFVNQQTFQPFIISGAASLLVQAISLIRNNQVQSNITPETKARTMHILFSEIKRLFENENRMTYDYDENVFWQYYFTRNQCNPYLSVEIGKLPNSIMATLCIEVNDIGEMLYSFAFTEVDNSGKFCDFIETERVKHEYPELYNAYVDAIYSTVGYNRNYSDVTVFWDYVRDDRGRLFDFINFSQSCIDLISDYKAQAEKMFNKFNAYIHNVSYILQSKSA